MACSCGGNGCDGLFTERFARRAMRRYLRQGLGGDELLIAEWATESGLGGATVLEVGGGVGALQAELLRRGAATGVVVDVVPAFEPFARELAQEAEIDDRTAWVLADLAEEPDAVGAADIVALRRVVCCSPYGPALLGAAARLTRRSLLASYPRRTWAIRAVARIQSAVFAALRKDFRVYIHDPAALDASAGEAGLSRTRTHRGLVWETVSYTRSAAV
jgi:magnesium-protoporphyrin O-methyltransferase